MSGPNILIIRTSALGDIVHTLPVLTALRRHHPKARLGWVVEESFAALLQNHPALDSVLTVNLRGWRRAWTRRSTWQQLRRFFSEVDRFAPEIVLDLMGNHKAGALAASTLCDRRIGLTAADRREPSSAVWMSHTVAARGTHAVDQALSVLDALAISSQPVDFDGEALFSGASSPATEAEENPPILLHPGTGWVNKNYPPERWGEVARRLHNETGKRIYISAGPGEDELAECVESVAGEGVKRLEHVSLPELATWIRRACLFLGGDTGPLHLAHAMGTPVLCVMGPTDPARNGPYDAPHMALWHRLPCSFCYRRYDSVKACLLEIPADAVAKRALEMLAESPTAQ